jgi:hypothetical protein
VKAEIPGFQFSVSSFQLSAFNCQLFFRFLPRLAYHPFPTSLTIHSVDRPRASFDHGR